MPELELFSLLCSFLQIIHYKDIEVGMIARAIFGLIQLSAAKQTIIFAAKVGGFF